MPNHLRCQVEYTKGFDNFADVLINDIKPITELDEVESFYFFWQDYSEKFHRHIQLDLIISEDVDEEAFRQKVGSNLEEKGRKFYWDKDFITTWFAQNKIESDILLKHRAKNAELALETLEEYREGNLDRKPSELVNRSYHLSGNQHGMTHWDEFKYCIKRAMQIPLIQLKHRLEIN